MAQDSRNRGFESYGLSLQQYPAGTIINIESSWAVSPTALLTGKLGYNIARRQDFGEHDKEEGGGPGFTAAYKRYLKADKSGWFIERRLGFWFLDIDWQDNTPLRTGNTDITVLQPTLGAGYDFILNQSRLKLGLFAAFGYEANIITSGEEVGQGGISLIGISIGFLSPKRGRLQR